MASGKSLTDAWDKERRELMVLSTAADERRQLQAQRQIEVINRLQAEIDRLERETADLYKELFSTLSVVYLLVEKESKGVSFKESDLQRADPDKLQIIRGVGTVVLRVIP